MPQSTSSRHSNAPSRDEADEEDDGFGLSSEEHLDGYNTPSTTSPATYRRTKSSRTSEGDLRTRMPNRMASEHSSLLANRHGTSRSYTSLYSAVSTPETPRPLPSRHNSMVHLAGATRHHNRTSSFAVRLANALGTDRRTPTGGQLTHSLMRLLMILTSIPKTRAWRIQSSPSTMMIEYGTISLLPPTGSTTASPMRSG